MPYHSIKDILNICKNDECEFWQVVLTEQVQESLASSKSVFEEMRRMYRIMKTAVNEYDENAVSAGKMAGGGGELMHKYNQKERKLLGDFLSLAAEYAIKTAESNACMKRIVAAPTAGACGVLPAVLVTYYKEYNVPEEKMIEAMYVAAGLGQIIANRAYLAGASGGCQAEIGSGSGMAAGAICYIKGGDTDQIGHACAMALKNLMGLVCDPVGGLVEVPCVKRNVGGAVNALAAADMALAGITSKIPVDQVIDAMKEVGDKMDVSLRETGVGGVAGTPAAQEVVEKLGM